MEEKSFDLMKNELNENYMGFFGTDEYDIEENIIIDDEKSFNECEVKLNLEFDDWFTDEFEPSPEIEKIKKIKNSRKTKLRLKLEKNILPKSIEEINEIKDRLEKLNKKFHNNLLKSKRKIKKPNKKSVVFNNKIGIKFFLKNQNIKIN